MARILNFSESTALAIHSLIIMTMERDKKFSTLEISKILSASVHHLSKVMQRLVKNKLIKSTRGPSGGFEVLKDPEEISLFDVYEMFEGDVEKKFCMFTTPACHNEDCSMSNVLDDIHQKVYEYYKQTSIKTLSLKTCRNQYISEPAS